MDAFLYAKECGFSVGVVQGERIWTLDEFAEDSSGSGRCGFLLCLVREVRRRGFSGRCRLLVFVGNLFRPLRSIVVFSIVERLNTWLFQLKIYYAGSVFPRFSQPHESGFQLHCQLE